MHKNTLLLTSMLAVIAALLVGFNVGRTIPQSPLPQLTPTIMPPPPTVTYLSGAACGVTFQYPNSLQAMESSISGTVLAHTRKPEESVVVVCQDDIPRVALPADKIETIVIQSATGTATISAKLYHDASPKDASPIDKLIFTHPKTGLDVFIGGFGPVFNQIIASIKLQ